MHRKANRRVHEAEFKARVLAECRRPGASVAGVALAHGLNANLLRKWLQGRGLKRCGVAAPTVAAATAKLPAKRREPTTEAAVATALQFLPIDVAGGPSAGAPKAAARAVEVAHGQTIDIALARGEVQLQVRWPASQASACGAWLHVLLMGPR
jgi:transposase